MSRKKALLASSLTVCTASASWAIGTDKHPVYALDMKDSTNPDLEQDLIAQEAIVHYLNPIQAVAEGNLAATVETKPLMYRVQKGDTLYQIGKFFGIPFDQLSLYNQIVDPNYLKTGQNLKIPLTRKWVRLQFGDTVESLAKEHQTTTDLLVYLNPILKDPEITYVGQMISVPQKLEVKSPETVPKPAPAKKGTIRLAAKSMSKPQKREAGSYRFHWPVSGQITSNFGWRNGRQHKGIDIWSAAKSGAVIRSSLDGVVTQAGYSGGYGNLVVVDHGGGWVTYYAHLSKISVSKGESVQTGQSLGNMGQTGNATGYHLHFEVRKDGQALNPLSVLK
ncbi:LysM peptidoglycan-binding domain-containing M23 family metallopeptidase [Hazenella coriacea]|uniref:Murein DD-endopeptidase MepM/ murein hydrolase activator NlpD n=1 Tax=Hazenella coriacea TaxID=1179467 RepID=A0A4R3L904_9BACL|nr:M23 family metallopeptidase [Hazenella coriacea]TCS95570.1 murein DD-endopeptidase MepM/ murein hydrolase activator NlpD [Hazenella coriacea]